jgi:RNA polymerase sigma-70 factor (ECF subfamily)
MSSTAVIGSDERLTEEDRGLLLEVEIERFLREVEKRAYRIAAIGIGDRDEAFDVVQDAMISLTRRYTNRPSEEWRPLFYRILNNRIRDWHRRRRVRDSVLRYFGAQTEEDPDPIALARDPAQTGPHDEAQRDETMAAL